jgi:hypothetical protein
LNGRRQHEVLEGRRGVEQREIKIYSYLCKPLKVDLEGKRCRGRRVGRKYELFPYLKGCPIV